MVNICTRYLITCALKKCYLNRLTKNVGESEHHAEYDRRKQNIDVLCRRLMQTLKDDNFRRNYALYPDIVASLIILYYELNTGGEWNNQNSEMLSEQLDTEFENIFGIKLSKILMENSVFDSQIIFTACLEQLNEILTEEDFKKYPSMVEVYVNFVGDVQKFHVKVDPLKTVPVLLIFINDYMLPHKLKGLNGCKNILSVLDPDFFKESNFYEVINKSVMSCVREKDLTVTQLVSKCTCKLLGMLSEDAKFQLLEDSFSSVLDELYIETNINRKNVLLEFVAKLISLHHINCIKHKKKIDLVLIENIDNCVNSAVREILFASLIEFLEEWIKTSWCIFSYERDHSLLTILFKLLYVSNKEECCKLENAITTLILLCEDEQKQEIFQQIENFTQKNPEYSEKVESIVAKVKDTLKS